MISPTDEQYLKEIRKKLPKMRSGFCYEIRQLASGILGYTEIARSSIPVAQNEREILDIIHSHAMSLYHIQDLLDFYFLIEAGLSKEEPADTDLCSSAEIAATVKKKCFWNLTIDSYGELPLFRADRTILPEIMRIAVGLLSEKKIDDNIILSIRADKKYVTFSFRIIDLAISEDLIKANKIAREMTSFANAEYGLAFRIALIYFWMRLHGGEIRFSIERPNEDQLRFLLPIHLTEALE